MAKKIAFPAPHASDAFAITPSDSKLVKNDFSYTFTIAGGSGYTNGTYNNTTMTYVSGKGVDSALVANITVLAGAVTAVTYVSGGADADATTVFTAPTSVIGAGTGFTATVNVITGNIHAYPDCYVFVAGTSGTVSVVTADGTTVGLYGTQGEVLGSNMPIVVKQIRSTGTAATSLIGFVGRNGYI